METGTLSSMYAQIVNGVAKEDSRFVTDERSSALWDQIAGEVAEAITKNPNVVFSIPTEMPDADDDDDEPTGDEPPGEAPPAEDSAQPPAADEPPAEPPTPAPGETA